jgi:hypothetical protein
MPAIAVQISTGEFWKKRLRINAIPQVPEWRGIGNFATLEGLGFPNNLSSSCALPGLPAPPPANRRNTI